MVRAIGVCGGGIQGSSGVRCTRVLAIYGGFRPKVAAHAARIAGVADASSVALIDGEHHPSVVRDALDDLERERGLAGVVFCGGEEKTGPAVLAAAPDHYGRDVVTGGAEAGLRALAGPGRAVVDLADEPVLTPERKLELAALA